MSGEFTPIILLAAFFLLVLFVVYVVYSRKISALNAKTEERARDQYQKWVARDLEALTVQQSSIARNIARREASAELNEWRIQNEAAIRQDAIARSRAVIVGKVTEH